MENSVPTTNEAPNRFAPWMVRIVAAWLLLGAFFKLFVGTPNDLPPVVRDLPLELGLTYRLAISIELAVGFCALLRPAWAWLLLAGALAVFDAVLVTQLGAESCGCFGSKVKIEPWVMMVIDSALLVGLLASRPWLRMRGGAPVIVTVLAIAVGIALPWFLDREVDTTTITADGETIEAGNAYKILDIEEWVGMDIYESPLAEPPLSEHIPLDTFIPDGVWVFWRATCDHCAAHLAEMATREMGERIVTLVQLRERHDTEGNRVVHMLPQGGFVQTAALPEAIEYVIQTPAELLVENGRIVAAKEGVGEGEGL